jgi:hypothetical protein
MKILVTEEADFIGSNLAPKHTLGIEKLLYYYF